MNRWTVVFVFVSVCRCVRVLLAVLGTGTARETRGWLLSCSCSLYIVCLDHTMKYCLNYPTDNIRTGEIDWQFHLHETIYVYSFCLAQKQHSFSLPRKPSYAFAWNNVGHYLFRQTQRTQPRLLLMEYILCWVSNSVQLVNSFGERKRSKFRNKFNRNCTTEEEGREWNVHKKWTKEQSNERTNEWTNVQMKERTNECSNEGTKEPKNERTNERTNEPMNQRSNKWSIFDSILNSPLIIFALDAIRFTFHALNIHFNDTILLSTRALRPCSSVKPMNDVVVCCFDAKSYSKPPLRPVLVQWTYRFIDENVPF